MLKEQLKKLKEQRKTIQIQRKNIIRFADTEDMDDESIYELIPVETPYTKADSLNFDRERHTDEKEKKFNRKFSSFLKSLVIYGDINEIEYLYDYLVRIYLVDTFNQKEMIFILLPYKKYYSKIKQLCCNTSFSYFTLQESYSLQFIANLCLKDPSFFNFFIGYFDYYTELKEFCYDVTRYIIIGLKNINRDYSQQFYEIINRLLAKNNKNEALELFFAIKDYVIEQLDEFIVVFSPFFDEKILSQINTEELRQNSVFNKPFHDDTKLFEQKYENGEERSILKEPLIIKKYILWVISEMLAPKNFTYFEYDALKVMYRLSDKKLDGTMEDYLNLFNELSERNELIKCLYDNFPSSINVLIQNMNDSDKSYLALMDYSLLPNLLTENNYSFIIKNLEKSFIKSNIKMLLNICFGYIKYNPLLFTSYVTNEVLFDLIQTSQDELFVQNLIFTAKASGISLTKEIMQEKLYTNDIYLDYIADKYSDLDRIDSVGKTIFETIKETPRITSIAAFLNFACKIKDPEFINDILKWIINIDLLPSNLASFIKFHKSLLAYEHLERVVQMKEYSPDVYFLLSDVFNKNSKLPEILINDGDYRKALLHLCKQFGFSKVLSNLKIENVMNFMSISSTDKMESNEMKSFISFLVSKIEISGQQVIDILMNEKYLLQMIQCTSDANWNVIKAIVCELLEKYPEHAQECYDYFINNYKDFSNDFDLLEEILQFGVLVDEENLVGVFRNSPELYKSEMADLLLRYTKLNPHRFIPYIVPALIKYKKDVVKNLFIEFGSVMGLYTKNILIEYPEASECLEKLDPKILVSGSIKAYNIHPDKSIIEFQNNILKDFSKSIPISSLDLLADFYSENLKNINVGTLENYFISCSLNKRCIYSNSLNILIRNIFNLDVNIFYTVALASLKKMTPLYTEYANVIFDNEVLYGNLDAIKFATKYLDSDLKYVINHWNLIIKTLEFFEKDNNSVYSEFIGAILNHNSDLIDRTNDLILSKLKGDTIVLMLNLLKVLYSTVRGYDRCIVKSSPYFALFADSTKPEISIATKKLLNTIEKYHKQSGYEILQTI